MNTPDGIEPLVGWRIWRIQHHHPLVLMGPQMRAPWPVDGITAVCAGRPEECQCPDPPGNHPVGPGCGIYAATHPEHLHQATTPFRHCVAGRIQAWGRIITHEHGFRAQHAKIDAIAHSAYTYEASRGLLEQSAHAYGVPLIEWPAMEMGAARDAYIERETARRLHAIKRSFTVSLADDPPPLISGAGQDDLLRRATGMMLDSAGRDLKAGSSGRTQHADHNHVIREFRSILASYGVDYSEEDQP